MNNEERLDKILAKLHEIHFSEGENDSWKPYTRDEAKAELTKLIEEETTKARIDELNLAIQGMLRQDNAKYPKDRLTELRKEQDE